MAKERLSKLQKTILKMCKRRESPFQIPYSFLLHDVAVNMGKYYSNPLGKCGITDWSFLSSFYRSIKNLADKGIIKKVVEYNKNYQTISLTEKGLIVLNSVTNNKKTKIVKGNNV